MDAQEKAELVARAPTEEIVTRDELLALFETDDSPRHYIGLEVSGLLHLGSLMTAGFKINDFARAGVKCTVFLADWHTVINDKLGGDWDAARRVSRYYEAAFGAVCPGVRIRTGSELCASSEYWADVVRFSKHMSMARTMRSLTIMGRSEADKTDLAKLLYPPMQAVDIHHLGARIAHAGMDQRKIHMLAREIFPKMGLEPPVAVHHRLLPGLGRPEAEGRPAKMSKSDPDSGISIHDTDEQIDAKIKKSWCEQGRVENNPMLAIARDVILHELGELNVERPQKFGGDRAYASYAELESDFAAGGVHPADLKGAVSRCLVKILAPVRSKVKLDEQTRELLI